MLYGILSCFIYIYDQKLPEASKFWAWLRFDVWRIYRELRQGHRLGENNKRIHSGKLFKGQTLDVVADMR